MRPRRDCQADSDQDTRAGNKYTAIVDLTIIAREGKFLR